MHSLIVSNPCPFTDKEDDNDDVDDDYDDDDDVVRALTNGQEVAKEVFPPPNPLRTK